MPRYEVLIRGWIIAADHDEVEDVLDDVAGVGVNIELAEVDGLTFREDAYAATAGTP